MIPTIYPISGQGGNIQIVGDTNNPMAPNTVVIQVRNWVIRKTFVDADVTTTGSGGWGENKRILAPLGRGSGLALDAARMDVYEGVKLTKGIYVPTGLDYPVPGTGTFQIGAAGTALEPNIPQGVTAVNGMQYAGKLLMRTHETRNPAIAEVTYRISFVGTGPLAGPQTGLIT